MEDDTLINTSGNSYVSWNWVANSGTTSSNTNGSVTSTVQVNTTAGFSISTSSMSLDKSIVTITSDRDEWI